MIRATWMAMIAVAVTTGCGKVNSWPHTWSAELLDTSAVHQNSVRTGIESTSLAQKHPHRTFAIFGEIVPIATIRESSQSTPSEEHLEDLHAVLYVSTLPNGPTPDQDEVQLIMPSGTEQVSEVAHESEMNRGTLLTPNNPNHSAAENNGPALLDPPRQTPSANQPWWQERSEKTVRESSQVRMVGLDEIILGALRHSPKVRAISNTPLIRETSITESEGQFDWRAFMETRFTDTSDPVGSSLTTGGPSRLMDKNWRYSSGFRRKMFSGGKFEVSQRVGTEVSNSDFFVPTNQANSKLALSFTQPLLNGAGRAYNTSLILLAQIDAGAAQDEFSKQLQDHLLEVTRAYWVLHLQRAVLLQKRKLHEQAVKILDELEARRGVDSLQSQIVRARAAVAVRSAEIIHSEMAIRNTESRIHVLVNDPNLVPTQDTELIPLEKPSSDLVAVSLGDSLATAMQNRPEIDQATKNVRAATVRLGISKKELKPVLDFVTEAYASGLQGDFALSKAYGDQFSEGRPTYSVGLVFEVPLWNREAKARYQRRRLELEQLTHELQNTIETLKAEVEIAVRLVKTSYREMQGKHSSMAATDEEVRYLEQRWRLLPGEDQAVSFLLDDLLMAQGRLATEEFDFVSAQVAYTLSLAELKRATGTLLQSENIEMTRTCENGLPAIELEKRSP